MQTSPMIPSIGKRNLSQIALGATSIVFGKAIWRNKKYQGTFSKLGIENTAIESNVSALAEAAVLQSETISVLQVELVTIKAHCPSLQQMANSSTTTPPDGMINMMVEAFKISQTNSVITNRSNSKRSEWTKDQNNDSTGKRKTRLYTHDH